MSTTTSTNPVVQAIVGGAAPPQARLAAARGLLPLPQADLLEVLVALRDSEDAETAEAAASTLESQESKDLLTAAKATETSAAVLAFIGSMKTTRDVQEAIILNTRTPDEAIVQLAGSVTEGSCSS